MLDDSTRGALSFAQCSAGRWPVIMKRTSKSRSRSRSRSTSALSAETLDLNGQPLRLTMMANREMSESANVATASCSVGSASIFEFGQQLVGFAGHGQCEPEAKPNQSAEDENLCQELLDEVKNQVVSASSDAAQCVVQDMTWTFEKLTISSESSDASNVQVCFFGVLRLCAIIIYLGCLKPPLVLTIAYQVGLGSKRFFKLYILALQCIASLPKSVFC